MGNGSDIDGDFSSGSDSDFNPMVVEEANDLDAKFMDGLEVFETDNSAEVTINSFSLTCRKRISNEENWVRNDRKKNEIWDWFI